MIKFKCLPNLENAPAFFFVWLFPSFEKPILTSALQIIPPFHFKNCLDYLG